MTVALRPHARRVPLVATKAREEVEYEAKTTRRAGRRHVHNRAEPNRGPADRASILAAPEPQLASIDNALVCHARYRRDLKAIRGDPQLIRRHAMLPDQGVGMPGGQAAVFDAVQSATIGMRQSVDFAASSHRC